MKAKLSFLLASLMIAIVSNSTWAQSTADSSKKNESDWISYRDAYKTMIWFEKYGKGKNLIQNRFQIVARDKPINFESVRLNLNSKNSVMNLALDVLGQTQLPLLKAAYDENAEISITPHIGQFSYRSRISIQLRSDGNYDINDLRTACEQSLQFMNHLDPSSTVGKKCVGVKFGFDKRDSNASMEVRGPISVPQAVIMQDNAYVWSDANVQLRIGQVRFDNLAGKSHVLTRSTPIIALAIIE